MPAAVPDGPGQQAETIASNLLLEASAGELVEALRAAGHESVLFKGVATARWLYDDEPRVYGDVDLLVDPAAFAECERLLEGANFERSRIEDVFAGETPTHASTWVRGPVVVDLHRTLAGLGVPAEEAWSVLSRRTETWTVGRVEVGVLDAPARTLVLALHMAQHGPEFARTTEDLERAIRRVPEPVWREAAEVARALQAETAMAAGLGAVAGGRELAERLALRADRPLEIEGSADFHAAQGLLWLLQTKGIRAQARYLRVKLFPPRSLMRSRFAWSRAGGPALAAAYALRLLGLAVRAPRALVTVVRLRRSRR